MPTIRFYVERDGKFLCLVTLDPTGLQDAWREVSPLALVSRCIDCGSQYRADLIVSLCGGTVAVYEDDHMGTPRRISPEVPPKAP